MRHFSVLRARATEGSTRPEPFPRGWFDFTQERLADFGAMYFLASLSSFNRDRSLAAITAQLEPPLRLAQYRVFRSGGHPRAFVTWAGLDTARERAFAVEQKPLTPQDWNSGDSKWVIDLVAPFGHVEQVIMALAGQRNETRVRTLWHNRKGTRARVMEFSRKTPGGPVSQRSYGLGQFRRLLEQG